MARRRDVHHHGRVTTPDDELPPLRKRSPAIAIVAWMIAAGMLLAIAAPVLVILFG